MIQYTVSMMCANFLNLEKDILVLNDYTDYYHIDIMDGHFVPNLALSLDFIKAIKQKVTKPIDAHLMVTNPNDYIAGLIALDVDYVTLHPNTISQYAFRIINKLKEAGIKVGIALSPSTDLQEIKYYIHLIDKLTIMTVEPGFAGQKMIQEMLLKIREAKEYREVHGYHYLIEIDGSNNKSTFEAYKKSGADILVLGTGLFNGTDLETTFKDIIQFVDRIVS